MSSSGPHGTSDAGADGQLEDDFDNDADDLLDRTEGALTELVASMEEPSSALRLVAEDYMGSEAAQEVQDLQGASPWDHRSRTREVRS